MTARAKRRYNNQAKRVAREFVVPRWKSQVIGTRSRRPRPVSLPKIAMQEAK